jgi:hypothetical protein
MVWERCDHSSKRDTVVHGCEWKEAAHVSELEYSGGVSVCCGDPVAA